jgi:hypothetical protein
MKAMRVRGARARAGEGEGEGEGGLNRSGLFRMRRGFPIEVIVGQLWVLLRNRPIEGSLLPVRFPYFFLGSAFFGVMGLSHPARSAGFTFLAWPPKEKVLGV